VAAVQDDSECRTISRHIKFIELFHQFRESTENPWSSRKSGSAGAASRAGCLLLQASGIRLCACAADKSGLSDLRNVGDSRHSQPGVFLIAQQSASTWRLDLERLADCFVRRGSPRPVTRVIPLARRSYLLNSWVRPKPQLSARVPTLFWCACQRGMFGWTGLGPRLLQIVWTVQ